MKKIRNYLGKKHDFHNRASLLFSRIMLSMSALSLGTALNDPVVYAAGYTGPINKLKTVLVTISGAIGAILGVIGAIKFAMAYKNHDNQGEQAAIYTLVAAGILIGLSAIITALGI